MFVNIFTQQTVTKIPVLSFIAQILLFLIFNLIKAFKIHVSPSSPIEF